MDITKEDTFRHNYFLKLYIKYISYFRDSHQSVVLGVYTLRIYSLNSEFLKAFDEVCINYGEHMERKPKYTNELDPNGENIKILQNFTVEPYEYALNLFYTIDSNFISFYSKIYKFPNFKKVFTRYLIRYSDSVSLLDNMFKAYKECPANIFDFGKKLRTLQDPYHDKIKTIKTVDNDLQPEYPEYCEEATYISEIFYINSKHYIGDKIVESECIKLIDNYNKILIKKSKTKKSRDKTGESRDKTRELIVETKIPESRTLFDKIFSFISFEGDTTVETVSYIPQQKLNESDTPQEPITPEIYISNYLNPLNELSQKYFNFVEVIYIFNGILNRLYELSTLQEFLPHRSGVSGDPYFNPVWKNVEKYMWDLRIAFCCKLESKLNEDGINFFKGIEGMRYPWLFKAYIFPKPTSDDGIQYDYIKYFSFLYDDYKYMNELNDEVKNEYNEFHKKIVSESENGRIMFRLIKKWKTYITNEQSKFILYRDKYNARVHSINSLFSIDILEYIDFANFEYLDASNTKYQEIEDIISSMLIYN